jgi:hypothetical protein
MKLHPTPGSRWVAHTGHWRGPACTGPCTRSFLSRQRRGWIPTYLPASPPRSSIVDIPRHRCTKQAPASIVDPFPHPRLGHWTCEASHARHDSFFFSFRRTSPAAPVPLAGFVIDFLIPRTVPYSAGQSLVLWPWSVRPEPPKLPANLAWDGQGLDRECPQTYRFLTASISPAGAETLHQPCQLQRPQVEDTPGGGGALRDTRLTRDGVWRWDTAEIPRAQCTMARQRASGSTPAPGSQVETQEPCTWVWSKTMAAIAGSLTDPGRQTAT